MPAPAPVPTSPDTLAVAAVVVAALGTVTDEVAAADGERVRAKQIAAVARNDRTSQAFADQDDHPAAGVAVAALGLVVVEGAEREGGRTSKLIVKSATLCTADRGKVVRGGSGVVSAVGLIVTEDAAGDVQAALGVGDGAAEAIVLERFRIAWTAVAAAAGESLVLGEGASRDGDGAEGVDAAAFGVADVRPGPAVAADGLIAADGTPRQGGGRTKDIQSAPVGPVVGRVCRLRGPGCR